MDQLVCTSRCLFCDWSFVGPTCDGREAAAAHRAKHHPGAVWKKKRVKATDSNRNVQYRAKEQIEDAYVERKRRAFLLGIDLTEVVE